MPHHHLAATIAAALAACGARLGWMLSGWWEQRPRHGSGAHSRR